MAWSTVCLPIQLRGLGISGLKNMMWALRMRCVWLQKKEPRRPWAALPIQAPAEVKAFFSITLKTEIGDGSRTLFWTDHWISKAVPCWFGSSLICYNSKEKNSKMYCSRRPHKPPLGFRFTGTTFSGSFNWLMTSLGSLIGFRTASWCQR